MARDKPRDRSPQLIPVAYARQILPGSFDYALCYLMAHEMDLSEFDHWSRTDEGGAASPRGPYAPLRARGAHP
jgi:hypothetical protein